MSSEYDVWFTEQPVDFLARAGEQLAADPVTGTVVATTAQRLVDHPEADLPYSWFAVVADRSGAVAGMAMRTAPFAPHPVYVLAMPEGAARALGRALVARGEEVGGVNGLRPAADVVAATVAAATGREVRAGMHTRLFELDALVEPGPVPGRLRAVRDDEADLALAWILQFFADADEQAGREHGTGHDTVHFTLEDVERKRADDVLRFWVDEDDRPLHLTGWNPPAFGVARIGPVYTPRDGRGRGLASAAVAEVSATLRDAGNRVILFTDQANPTSNGVYQALGYQPVVDTIDLRLG